ncbi:segregation/condensation protein A [bacterium]|nr:segregation/condensation protein A [bacterium]
MSEYRVTLSAFEGPLDLLLHLVRKNEYDIFDIPIAEITRQYLDFLELMTELNLEIASEYLLMSATLMKIKSAMLLPRPEDAADEGDDPRAELVRQILEFERFREAAHEFGERELLGRDVFARKFTSPEIDEARKEPAFLQVNMFDLMEALKGVLARAKGPGVTMIAAERYSIRQRMTQIIEVLGKTPNVRFEKLFEDDISKGEIIITFLAILELMRLQYASIVQEARFGPIHVLSKLAPDEPVEIPDDIESTAAGAAPMNGHPKAPAASDAPDNGNEN